MYRNTFYSNNSSKLIMDYVECSKCRKLFSTRSGLRRHLKTLHQEVLIPTGRSKLECSWSHQCLEENCDSAFRSKKCLIKHLTIGHHMKFHTEHLLMDDVEVFQMWKSKIERECGCYYVSKGKANLPNGETTYYYCNRSKTGYVTKKRTIRERTQGSCKLKYACTSQIKVTKEDIGVVIEWQTVHYGHGRDLRYLRLSKEDKQYIVARLKKGKTPDSIVRSFQKQDKEHLRRLHLVTLKDILRISRLYGIKVEKASKNEKLLLSCDKPEIIWVKSDFPDEQTENLIDDYFIDNQLENETMCQDTVEDIEKEKFCQYDETNSSQMFQDTDETGGETVTQVAVFNTKPILITQVKNMLSNLSNINFETLPDPVLNDVHQHLFSITELLSFSNDEHVCDPQSCDERSVIDAGSFVQAPDDSIILIVENDSKNKVVD